MTAQQSNKIANLGFVCALLVVFIHLKHVPQDVGSLAWTLWYVIREIFASVAVPFFFLTSGFLLAGHVGERGWWLRAVRQRAKTLGLPYLIWCLVPFVLFSLLWTSTRPDGECMRSAMKASSVAAAFGLNLFTSPEANRPLWFVRCLLIFVLISPALAFLLRKSRGWLIALLFAFLLVTNSGTLDVPNFWLSLRWQIFWVFGLSTEGLFYFTLGLWFRTHPPRLPVRFRSLLGGAGLILGCCGLGARLAGFPYWSYLATLSIPLTLILAWSLIPSRRFSPLLTGSSFAIYVMHAIVIKTVDETGLIPAGGLWMFAEWCLVSGVALGAAILFQRFLPAASAAAFGGRNPTRRIYPSAGS